MIVVVMVTKVTVAKVIFLGFVVIVNKRRTIGEKLVGIGSVIENYAGCGSSCNSHNIG